MERRLAAILAADVVGYTRLMGEDEPGTLAGLKLHRTELIEPKAAQYNGRTIKLMGDGALMEFPSVVEAVSFAVEVQFGMRARNAGLPEGRRIVLRIGINIGDVIVEKDNIYGDGVNLAARLEQLAEPGGICVNRAVRNQVRDKVRLAFEDRGEIDVKNVARPVRVFAVSLNEAAEALVTPVERRAAPKSGRWRPALAAGLAICLDCCGCCVVATMGAGRRNRGHGTLCVSLAGATLYRGPAIRKPKRQCGSGLLCRRDHCRSGHGTFVVPRIVRYRPQLVDIL